MGRQMLNCSRRKLLRAATSLAAVGVCGGVATASVGMSQPAPGLAAHAAARGMFYGCAIDHDTLAGPPAALAHVPAECSMVVGEYSFKWDSTQPARNDFSFTRADAVMDFAERNRLRVRGHNLLWHEAVPAWLPKILTPANGEALLTQHIEAVAGRYRGRMAHWDVANEVVQPDDMQPLNLRDTLWTRALGARCLDVAFEACARADPTALRVLNEFGTDYAIPWQERKRAALLTLLADLVARRVPIQAVGLQAHLDAAEVTLDQAVLAKFVADIASMGLKIVVTELDVRDNRLPADPVARDIAVAEHAGAWLDAVLPNPAVLGVLTWGLSDKRSWLDAKFPRPDGLPQRPLPLDDKMSRKRLWSSIAAGFDGLTPRLANRL